MGWREFSYGVKFGIILSVIVLFGMGIFAIVEYTSCYPEFEGMCGVGIVIFGSFFGLGVPYLILNVLDSAAFFSTENVLLSYSLSALLIILTMMVTYFIIGWVIGWIYGKIKSRTN